jgi:prevent-host-death family protein
MEISANELRGKPGRIIELAERGTDIVITLRGKKKARLIPYKPSVRENAPDYKADTIFGMWADKGDIENVDDYIQSVRKGRTF